MGVEEGDILDEGLVAGDDGPKEAWEERRVDEGENPLDQVLDGFLAAYVAFHCQSAGLDGQVRTC